MLEKKLITIAETDDALERTLAWIAKQGINDIRLVPELAKMQDISTAVHLPLITGAIFYLNSKLTISEVHHLIAQWTRTNSAQEKPAKKAKTSNNNRPKVKRVKHTVKGIASRIANEEPFTDSPAGTFDVLNLTTIECTVCHRFVHLSGEGKHLTYWIYFY